MREEVLPFLHRNAPKDAMSLYWPVVVIFVGYFLGRSVLRSRRKHADAIPLAKVSSSLLPWELRFLFRGIDILQQAADNIPAFVLPVAGNKTYFICKPHLVKELADTTDSRVSIYTRLISTLQTDYTMPGLFDDEKKSNHMVSLVRTKISGNLNAICPPLVEESIATMQRVLENCRIQGPNVHGFPDNSTATSVINAFELSMTVIARASSRAFVGLPLCRDENYIGAISSFTQALMIGAPIVRIFPVPLKTFAARYLCNVWPKINTVKKCVRPIVEKRLEENAANNGEPVKNDLIQSLMTLTTAAGKLNIEEFAIRLLSINFGALFTTSFLLMQSMYELVYRQEYVAPLRKEIDQMMAKHGQWTKEGLDDLWLLDSFLKETQRLHPHEASSIGRTVAKEFAFSDGTTLPPGSTVFVPTGAIMRDSTLVERPNEFDGYRSYRARVACAESGQRQDHTWFTSPGMDALGFGIGRHACPGRFFAALELKLILGFLVHNYDLFLKDSAVRPSSWSLYAFILPDTSREVILKPRLRDTEVAAADE